MIKAAIIGMGRWGQVLVDSVQGKSETIVFIAGVTRTVSRAAHYAERQGFPLGDDYDAVLADPAIDAIVLATPHSQHADQIDKAAAAGKHIFVEKPFTLTSASAAQAVAVADAAGIVLALGHNRRFMPSRAELKSRIDSGSIGTLLHVEGNFSGSGGLKAQAGNWRGNRLENPAGGMGAMGIHMVDMMIGLFGPIADVRCISRQRAVKVDIDDTTSMLFTFESGMTGNLVTLGATVPTQRIQVFGTEGSAEIRQERYFEFRPVEGEAQSINFGPFDKEKAELEAFAAAIAGKAPYPLPANEAIHGIAVFEAIVKSAASGTVEAVA